MVAGLGGGRGSYPPPFIAALVKAGFHVMTYDHRDVGASTRLTDAVAAQSPFRGLIGGGTPAYTAEDMTDDAVAVMDTVGWGSAHVFGLSIFRWVASSPSASPCDIPTGFARWPR